MGFHYKSSRHWLNYFECFKFNFNKNLLQEDLEVREEDETVTEKEGSCEKEPRTKEQQRRAAARKSCSLSPYRELEDFR